MFDRYRDAYPPNDGVDYKMVRVKLVEHDNNTTYVTHTFYRVEREKFAAIYGDKNRLRFGKEKNERFLSLMEPIKTDAIDQKGRHLPAKIAHDTFLLLSTSTDIVFHKNGKPFEPPQKEGQKYIPGSRHYHSRRCSSYYCHRSYEDMDEQKLSSPMYQGRYLPSNMSFYTPPGSKAKKCISVEYAGDFSRPFSADIKQGENYLPAELEWYIDVTPENKGEKITYRYLNQNADLLLNERGEFVPAVARINPKTLEDCYIDQKHLHFAPWGKIQNVKNLFGQKIYFEADLDRLRKEDSEAAELSKAQKLEAIFERGDNTMQKKQIKQQRIEDFLEENANTVCDIVLTAPEMFRGFKEEIMWAKNAVDLSFPSYARRTWVGRAMAYCGLV